MRLTDGLAVVDLSVPELVARAQKIGLQKAPGKAEVVESPAVGTRVRWEGYTLPITEEEWAQLPAGIPEGTQGTVVSVPVGLEWPVDVEFELAGGVKHVQTCFEGEITAVTE